MNTLLLRRCAAIALAAVLALPALAQDQNLGLVADDGSGSESVHVLDLNTNTVVTTIDLPVVGVGVGDVAISQDGTTGFVTTFDAAVYVVDLTLPTPALASGTNPIPISNPGEDFAVTPDGNYLLVSDGSAVAPLSVIDIAARAEVDTENVTGSDHNNLDICDDGVTVLAGGVNVGRVASGIFDPLAGTVSSTGNFTSAPRLNNSYCAPGSQAGIAITRDSGRLISFTIGAGGALTAADNQALPNNRYGISGVFSPDGTVFYARYQTGSFPAPGAGTVAAFTFDPVTGAIGDTPLYEATIFSTQTFFGMDQLSITDDGSLLYVSDGNQVAIFNAATGAAAGAITDDAFVGLTGITGRRAAPLADVECPSFFAISDYTASGTMTESVEIQTNAGEDLLGLYLVLFDAFSEESYSTTALTGSADGSGQYSLGDPGSGSDQSVELDINDGPGGIVITKSFVAPGTNVPSVASPFPGEICASVVYVNDDIIVGQYSTGGVTRVATDGTSGDLLAQLREAAASAAPDAGPDALALDAAFPNPFSERTTVRFAIPEQGPVSLVVFDALGREVRRLVDGTLDAGHHEVAWDGTGDGGRLASGLYIVRLTAAGESLTRQATLMR